MIDRVVLSHQDAQRRQARARGGRPSTALKVLGAHPKTKAPVELHSGKYGPYVKHGAVNATLPDRAIYRYVANVAHQELLGEQAKDDDMT